MSKLPVPNRLQALVERQEAAWLKQMEDPRHQPKKRLGRPKKFHEPREPLNTVVPLSLKQALQAEAARSGVEVTTLLEKILRAGLNV